MSTVFTFDKKYINIHIIQLYFTKKQTHTHRTLYILCKSSCITPLDGESD